MKQFPKVLHIDVENGWRGGQRQALYLFESEIKNGMDSHFICRANSDMHQTLRKNNLPHNSVNYKNEIDLISAYKIAGIARRNNYNIINCHSSHSLSIGLLSKYFFSKPKLIGIRRVDFKISENLLSKWKYNSSKLDKLICVSEAIRIIMKQTVTNENKLHVIHDGIALSKFINADSTKLKSEFNIQNQIIVGTIAAFVGHKDYPTLLRTVKKVCEVRNDILFVALGDGELFDEMKKMSEELKIQDKIIFTGFRNDVSEFLNLFDIFILTSNEEGLGSSILDAMSVGLPIVATKAGGIPEMVKHEENGLLSEIADYSSLANAVLKLSDNPELRNLYGQNSKEKVQNFSIEKTFEKYFNLYNDLLY